MSGGGLKSFLVLSLAVHATVLVTWTPVSREDAGHPGRVLHLALEERAGQAVTDPARPVAREQARPAAPPPAAPSPASPAGNVPLRSPPPEAAATPVAAPAGKSRHVPAAPVAAAGPAPSPQPPEPHLRERVLEVVAANLTYPPLARRKGWEGTVRLQLRVEPDGRISHLRVSETSGYPVLDRAALEALHLASVPRHIPRPASRAVDLVVPVEYRLLDARG